MATRHPDSRQLFDEKLPFREDLSSRWNWKISSPGTYSDARGVIINGALAQEKITVRRASLATELFQRTFDGFSGTDERVAFVMHADIELLFLQQFHSEWLDVPSNTSVTTIQITAGDCRLEDYNCVRHLPDQFVTW